MLHTLRHALGEDAFWTATRRYLEERGDSTAHTRHFQAAFEACSGRNLDRFFQQWVFGAGHPELTVKLSWESGLLSVDVAQKQSAPQVAEAFHFDLKIVIRGADGAAREVALPVRERARVFSLPAAEEPHTVCVDPGFRVLARVALEAPRSWLVALLQDDCPVARVRAARALAKTARPAAVDALCAALVGDPAWYVRAELAKTLGRAGGAAARAALLAALDGPADSRARTLIVTALGRRPDPAVEERLLRIVLEGDPSYYVEGAAGQALGQRRSRHPLQAARARRARESWGEILRARALQALGASCDEAALAIALDWTGPERPPPAPPPPPRAPPQNRPAPPGGAQDPPRAPKFREKRPPDPPWGRFCDF